MGKWTALLVVLFALTCQTLADETVAIIGDELEGPNVCKRIDHYNVTLVVTDMVPYQEVKNVWCAQPPFRCRKTEVKMRQVERTEVHEKTRAIRECCEGYKETPARNKCVPKCDKPCINGQCAAPNQCKCESGFGGPSCDISESLNHSSFVLPSTFLHSRLPTQLFRQKMQEEVRLHERSFLRSLRRKMSLQEGISRRKV
jgi:hypothetical protein